MTEAANPWNEEQHFRRDAVNGSRKLLLAILHSQGIYLSAKKKRKPYKAVEVGKKYPPHPAITPIQDTVAEYYGIDPDHIHIDRRLHWCARPRQMCMFLAHTVAGISLPQIARHFGRDHTTVLHAVRAIPANGQLAADAEALRALIASIPVNIGDRASSTLPNTQPEMYKEHSGNAQEERLAA